MGEYAMRGNDRIKIGTCEDMHYLRADQRHQVEAEQGKVDPGAYELRFRFPFPDEDDTPPGGFKDAVCWCEHPDRKHDDGGPCKVCSCQGFNFNGGLRNGHSASHSRGSHEAR